MKNPNSQKAIFNLKTHSKTYCQPSSQLPSDKCDANSVLHIAQQFNTVRTWQHQTAHNTGYGSDSDRLVPKSLCTN